MKTPLNITLAVSTIVALTVSTAVAGGYDWRQKVTYGNDPTKRSTTSSGRSYAARPFGGSRSAYSYEPVQGDARRAYSYEPAAPASFKVGDTIVVAAASVPLKLGDRVVATVPQGQRVTVSSVEGPWVGTNVEQNGQTIGGWVLASELAGASPSATSVQYAPTSSWSGCGCR